MAFRRGLRGVSIWVVAALAGGAFAADRPAAAQVISVNVKSVGDLLGKFRAAAKATGGEAAKSALDVLDELEIGGALKWLDRTKPLSVVVDLPAAAPGSPPGSPIFNVFLPVAGRDAFLDALRGFGFEVDDQPGAAGFSHRVAHQAGGLPPLFLLEKPPTGYAVLTSVPADAAKLTAAALAALAPTRPGAVVVSVRIDRVPDAYKQVALAAVHKRDAAERKRKPGETDEAHQGRVAVLALVEDAAKSLLVEGRELSLDLDVAAPLNRLTIALGLEARPDTDMAAALNSFGARRTRFQNLVPDPAANLRGIVPIVGGVHDLIQKAIESGRAKAARNEDPEARRIANLMIDALAPTLSGDVLDGCVNVAAPAATGARPGAPVILFGLAVKGSQKVEAALREAIGKMKPDDRAKVSLDSARGDDGTSIHRVKIDDADQKLKRSGMTDPRLFIAFPEGAAVAVVGNDDSGLAAITHALSALKKPAVATAVAAAIEPQAALDVSLGRMAALSEEADRDALLRACRDSFSGANAGKDRLHLGLTGGAGRAILRLEADLPVFRFFSQVGFRSRVEKAAPVQPGPR